MAEKVDVLKIAIDDLRAGLKTQHDVILFVDRQAGDMLRLYVTIAIAAGSVAFSQVAGDDPRRWISASGLVVVVAMLTVGSVFCFQAINQRDVRNPSRLPEFWRWAAREDVGSTYLFDEYLVSIKESRAANSQANVAAARAYRRARWVGAAAAPAGMFAALVVYLVTSGFTSLFSSVH